MTRRWWRQGGEACHGQRDGAQVSGGEHGAADGGCPGRVGDGSSAAGGCLEVVTIGAHLEVAIEVGPKDARAMKDLANSHASVGYCLLQLGDLSAAQTHFEQQRKLDEELIRLDPMGVTYRNSLSEAYENLGRVALRLGQKEKGRNYLREALKIYDELGARGVISAEYAHIPARIRSELK